MPHIALLVLVATTSAADVDLKMRNFGFPIDEALIVLEDDKPAYDFHWSPKRDIAQGGAVEFAVFTKGPARMGRVGLAFYYEIPKGAKPPSDHMVLTFDVRVRRTGDAEILDLKGEPIELGQRPDANGFVRVGDFRQRIQFQQRLGNRDLTVRTHRIRLNGRSRVDYRMQNIRLVFEKPETDAKASGNP